MKIAAFDSGIGGLTTVAPLLKHVPGLDITYLGDLANLPYGTKSPERIRQLVRANLEWLLDREQFELVVLACNTASAHAMDLAKDLAQTRGIPCVGVIEPGCRQAKRSNAKRVVVLATGATVSSEAYLSGLRTLGYSGEIAQKACPLFVPLVEDALTAGPAVEEIARRYLDPVLAPGDAVILGCTHYPLLLSALQKIYPTVTWIDAGGALLSEGIVRPGTGASKLTMLFTDDVLVADRVAPFLSGTGLHDLAHTIERIAPLI